MFAPPLPRRSSRYSEAGREKSGTRGVVFGLLFAAASVAQSPAPAPTSTDPSFSHSETNRDAFSRPAPALSAAELRVFNFGNRLFNTNWVVAPASAAGFDGLGPTFNRVSCSGCHLRDGRGRPPIDGETQMLSMLVRISVPGQDAHGGPKPVPGYGGQINDHAIPGVAPEARVELRWQELPGRYADGTAFSLRKPMVQFKEAAYGALPKTLLTSPRVAPAVFGLGLVDALSDADILALEDVLDANKDGISGRANRVYSPTTGARDAVGRYGWKANVATLAEQNLGAAVGDIGITSPLHPEQNCAAGQTACAKAVNGGAPELSAQFAEKLTLYVQMLGVPQPRPLTAQSTRGESLFRQFQCSGCHVETLTTAANSQLAFLRTQRFAPLSDFLLHDMGNGLADGRPDFGAGGSEWRTTPLWGFGLVPTVNEHALYLHDGRARGAAEAILWHDGEAKAAKEQFRSASATDRAALIAFLNRL
jgi:CxxC motif-containing protein (DUF1111 family)